MRVNRTWENMGKEHVSTVTPKTHEPRDFNAAHQVVISVSCNRRDLASQYPADEAVNCSSRGLVCTSWIFSINNVGRGNGYIGTANQVKESLLGSFD